MWAMEPAEQFPPAGWKQGGLQQGMPSGIHVPVLDITKQVVAIS